MSQVQSIITGSGHYLPNKVMPNESFGSHSFYTEKGEPFSNETADIIRKFYDITGIQERRYLEEDLKSSDMAAFAGKKAIAAAGINREDIDQVIVAHNFGDIRHGSLVPDLMPSLAAKVKNLLNIKNPSCVAYDIIFGCPGWVQAMIQADIYIKSGNAQHCLVIGTEALSRVVDPSDRDSMIFADGAGAFVLSAGEGSVAAKTGMLTHASVTHAMQDVNYLSMGESNKAEEADNLYIKMQGRRIYNYALLEVPKAIKSCLDKANVHIDDVSKVLIHQANEKMDMAIGDRLYSLYGYDEMPKDKMPMNIQKMGNNSVATVPVLYDMIANGDLDGHSFGSGDLLVMASVGAGMSINAFLYRIP
ncbi:MAG: ketoacyl-ACP synthase III [Bacteroidetes bacterium]|jgi:3-oxoacyl-[acyl-carrier-protein] synthase-3|nr:ketoacyl-ACP synthase III [Bacteroidota bacterium]